MADTQRLAAPTDHAPRSPARLGHRPALDGVRGIAIAIVVLFHYPWGVRHPGDPFSNNPVHGGFLGVDAFFVLSGFLITTLLLQEHAKFGRVSFRRFYARRGLRLLPALAVLFAIAVFLHFQLPAGNDNRPQTSGLLGVLFYVANWVNIYQPKALGITADTWSLAIEEQFYLLWPILLLFLLRRGLRTRTIAIIAAVGIATSAAWRAWYWYDRVGGHASNIYERYAQGLARPGAWNRIYFGSDTRADTLLAGALTAILLFWWLPRVGPRVRAFLGVASIFALVASALFVLNATVFVSGWMPEWGFLAFELSIAVLIAGLVAMPRGLLARGFGLVPLVWLGSRSYAVYLFHQLVFVYLGRSRIHLSPGLSLVFQLVAIGVAAELSYRLVEAPMLRLKRRFEPDAPSRNPDAHASHSIVSDAT